MYDPSLTTIPTNEPLAGAAIGLLVLRLTLGTYMAAHGAQKLFGWFGGYGLSGTSQFFEHLGFRPARMFVIVASLTEIVSGLLVVFGFLGPIGPALLVSVLIVAAISVHWEHGWFVTQNGVEYAVVAAVASFALALVGMGPYSLDAALGIDALWTPYVTWTALTIGVLGATMNLMLRRKERAAPQAN